MSHPKFALLRGPIPCYAAHCSKLEKKADLARMNARIQNKWEHCVARFVGQASHGVHMREPNTRIETICKSQSCMVLSETEQAKVGQASHGVHMRDRLMLVRARSVPQLQQWPFSSAITRGRSGGGLCLFPDRMACSCATPRCCRTCFVLFACGRRWRWITPG